MTGEDNNTIERTWIPTSKPDETTAAADETDVVVPKQLDYGTAVSINSTEATPLKNQYSMEGHKVMRSAFFTMFPLFMAYASLVTLQAKIKGRLHIKDDSSTDSYEFGFAVSLLYLGNLIFRLLHNVIFCFLTPRHRVTLSYFCMSCSTAILAFAYYMEDSKWLGWVYFAYGLGGVGIGTFESNLISCLTPLGHETKAWAQYGIPIGFNGVSVGAFILFASFPGVEELVCGVYLFISVSCILGMLFWVTAIPNVSFESTDQGLRRFLSDVAHWREWMWLALPYSIALLFDMGVVTLSSSVQQYIYDLDRVPLWWRARTTISKDTFRAIFNSCSLVGDATGRKLAYRSKNHVNPFWFLLCSGFGLALVFSKLTIAAPLGMLLVMFANGSIYAHTTKYIDNCISHRFNLISLSFWLFVGDAGSFTGANVVNPLRVLIGGVPPPS